MTFLTNCMMIAGLKLKSVVKPIHSSQFDYKKQFWPSFLKLKIYLIFANLNFLFIP